MDQTWGMRKRGVKESSLTPRFFWFELLALFTDLWNTAVCFTFCLISSHHCEGGLAYIIMRMDCKGFNCRSIPSSYLASRDT